MLTQKLGCLLLRALRVLRRLPSQDSAGVLGFVLEDTSLPHFTRAHGSGLSRGGLRPLLSLLALQELPSKERSTQPWVGGGVRRETTLGDHWAHMSAASLRAGLGYWQPAYPSLLGATCPHCISQGYLRKVGSHPLPVLQRETLGEKISRVGSALIS